MELVLLSSGLSLLAGLAIGYLGHVLQSRQADNDRAIESLVELWDKCGEIASARVRYILAYHRKAPDAGALNEAHKDLKRRYRWADPEVVLIGVPEWEAYHDAERAALKLRPLSRDQIKAIDHLGYALSDAIGERRKAARNSTQ